MNIYVTFWEDGEAIENDREVVVDPDTGEYMIDPIPEGTDMITVTIKTH